MAVNMEQEVKRLTARAQRAELRICELCGICRPSDRDIQSCEIAAVGPEFREGDDD